MGNITQNEKVLLKAIRNRNLEDMEFFIDGLVERQQFCYDNDMRIWKKIEQAVEEEGGYQNKEEEVNNRLRALGWRIQTT